MNLIGGERLAFAVVEGCFYFKEITQISIHILLLIMLLVQLQIVNMLYLLRREHPLVKFSSKGVKNHFDDVSLAGILGCAPCV